MTRFVTTVSKDNTSVSEFPSAAIPLVISAKAQFNSGIGLEQYFFMDLFDFVGSKYCGGLTNDAY